MLLSTDKNEVTLPSAKHHALPVCALSGPSCAPCPLFLGLACLPADKTATCLCREINADKDQHALARDSLYPSLEKEMEKHKKK